MENQNVNQNNQTAGDAGNAQEPQAGNAPDLGKLFTQADVDRIVGNRLSRMKQDIETAEGYRRERDEARRELEQYKNNAFLKEKGVKELDIDYVTYKAMQLVSDTKNFQQAAAEFLSQNPRFTGQGYRIVSTGLPDKGSGHLSEEDEIRRRMGLN